MFNFIAMVFSSVATFLFPVFASYKALKTSDPALLTPWLMYWVVLACALLFESWTEFILVWIPFYPWIRLSFLLYLILPNTQGAKLIYTEHLHPFLYSHEVAIDDFIASAHDRAKAAGLSYFRHGLDLLRQYLLGMPPKEPSPPPTPTPASYTQSLIARFNLPNARPAFAGSWGGVPASASAPGGAATGPSATGATATDFYALLAAAVSAASSHLPASQQSSARDRDLSNSGTLIPPSISGDERISFIAAQRERLAILLSALDREASNLQGASSPSAPTSISTSTSAQSTSAAREMRGAPGLFVLGVGEDEETVRPASAMSGLSKSRSEADFETIDKDDGSVDDAHGARPGVKERSGSWLPWSWGAAAEAAPGAAAEETEEKATGKSSGLDI